MKTKARDVQLIGAISQELGNAIRCYQCNDLFRAGWSIGICEYRAGLLSAHDSERRASELISATWRAIRLLTGGPL